MPQLGKFVRLLAFITDWRTARRARDRPRPRKPPRTAARRHAPPRARDALCGASPSACRDPAPRPPSLEPDPGRPGLRCTSCAHNARRRASSPVRSVTRAGVGRRAPPHCRRASAALPRRAHRPARPSRSPELHCAKCAQLHRRPVQMERSAAPGMGEHARPRPSRARQRP